MTEREGVLDTAAVARWDIETEVLVVGAGGCGLTAALAAAEGGASVLVVERDRRPICNTARSSGMLPAAGTRIQRAAGIEESPEGLVADIQRKNKGRAAESRVRHLAHTATTVVDWLTGTHDVRLELVTDFLYPGNTQFRMHAPPERIGAPLVADLKRAVTATGHVELIADVDCEALVADPDGTVRGAVIRSGGRELVAARRVILACNGFGGNPQMIRRYCPEIADALYFGGPGSTGEGIQWGMALGAATAFMDAYQGQATIAVPGEVYLSYSVTMNGGFHVNVRGERFADETRGYSEHARDVIAQPGNVAFLIYDTARHAVGMTFEEYRRGWDAGLIRVEPTLRDLAVGLGVDPEGLERTYAEYRQAASVGRDRFGRTTFADLRPPFYGARVTGALFHTQGGLVVDEHARVLCPDGSVIANLYAGGGVAAGISGPGADGYLSGNGLLTAFTYGYLAGRHAALGR